MKALDFMNVSDPTLKVNLEIIQGAIKDLEDGKANITSGAGAPAGGSANDLHVDTSGNRLYVNVAGTWKYASLT